MRRSRKATPSSPPASAAAIPQGLVIGKVTGIAGSRQEVFRSVTVEPLASLARARDRAGHDQLRAGEADGAVSYYIGIPLVVLAALAEVALLPLLPHPAACSRTCCWCFWSPG